MISMWTKIYDTVGNLNVRQCVFVLFLLINAQDCHPKLLKSHFPSRLYAPSRERVISCF